MTEVDRIWHEVECTQAKIDRELRIMDRRLESIEKTQKEILENLEKATRNSINRQPFVSRGGSLSV
jgi:hypothetical protein